MSLQIRPALAPALEVSASMQDGPEDPWEQLANKYWLKSVPRKVNPESLKNELWNPLEREHFSLRSLVALENLQVLERFLWPTFSQDSSNQHVLLVATFFNVKQRGHLQSWSVFADRPDEFSNLFRRILSLNLDTSLSPFSRLVLLNFVIGAFQSLEKEFVRKECAPLVSISIWHNLHSATFRERLIEESPARRKAWKAALKRFEAADAEGQIRMKFDRSWLFSMILDFLNRTSPSATSTLIDTTYCERFLELLIDLVSQLPTRRYTNSLIKDLNVLPILRKSKLVAKEENSLLRDLAALLEHFQNFAIDDAEGQETTTESIHATHYRALAQLQRIAIKQFESKLKVLALSNYASISNRDELASHFSSLTDIELAQLCTSLGFRTSYPPSVSVPTGKDFLLEILLSAYARPLNFQESVERLSVMPKEASLYDPKLLRNESYDGSRPLAVPKLNLQYLSLSDFMWRSFQLYQAEAFYGIRKDMESLVKRMKPRAGRDGTTTLFDGFSKMALPIDKPGIIEVGPPKVGNTYPGFVRAEVVLDVSRLTDSMRRDWDNLRPKDVVFLLTVNAPDQSEKLITNGNAAKEAELESGLIRLRSAEVVQVLDDSGRALRDISNTNGFVPRPRRRRLLIDIDPIAFQSDKNNMASGRPDIYASMNVIARRQGRENNFKPVLETIQKLVGARAALPSWFQEVFLGYGDPKSASYGQLVDKIESIDFLDTFLDWDHLNESFTNRKIEADEEGFGPPYVLDTIVSTTSTAAPSNPKKRRRDQMEDDADTAGPIRVRTYKPRNTGPYPVDVPKKNTVRFTPKQVEGIVSGTQPGLSVIVGPPGTGKTDVATQIINLLYHNFPSERILLVAHSNQALNQLFQKIIALDIDPRHLLRLGHGEEELDTEESYSKAGRVESFLDNRQAYLFEVNRLAASVGAEGAHGSTCETADYFNQVYIKPAWTRFWDILDDESASTTSMIDAFPFQKFFSNAPVPELFNADMTIEELRYVAEGCQHHIKKIFSELESIRPFEILRHSRDQANHLLIKEARIIAMTSTHAAMRRSEIAELGFHYDTLIMEEAAQITEMECFIPCAMQNPDPKTSEPQLKRIVLVGDHLQNSPVIQNMALRQYANFEQSLFLRLVRLGVPTIHLDAQGRCRPSLASLFSSRYNNLGNLPHLSVAREFISANAGFRYDYQFIDVPDYQGQGEREPTPHFIQNLGEAEYAVALYQYMRLLGYPARSITILTTYAGQRALIKDVLDHRCKGNKLFGLPKHISTVDKYQGEQNDYVILSMTRTKSVGYLRDIRRLTVALSRARLGLYILGRRELFESCYEMSEAMSFFSQRSEKLSLVTGEMFPTTRLLDDDVEEPKVAEMEGVEHLGQYVYEMTQAKIKAMGGQASIMDTRRDRNEGETNGVDLDEPEGLEEVGEEDPLHEVS